MMKIRKLHLSNKLIEVDIPKELCIVCFDEEATRSCIPCAHDVVCDNCAKMFIFNVKFCPLCRYEIKILSRTK